MILNELTTLLLLETSSCKICADLRTSSRRARQAVGNSSVPYCSSVWRSRLYIDCITPSRTPCSSTSIGVATECLVRCDPLYIEASWFFYLPFHSIDSRLLA